MMWSISLWKCATKAESLQV
ncbi:hypothetical protein V3C99_017485, partial [Haemonchus contortus]